MPVQDEWVLFLEKHPQFFEISKSRLFISILKRLEQSGTSFDSLVTEFPGIDREDLEVMLSTLEKIKAVECLDAGGKRVFILTGSGREFLQKYDKTRRFFKA